MLISGPKNRVTDRVLWLTPGPRQHFGITDRRPDDGVVVLSHYSVGVLDGRSLAQRSPILVEKDDPLLKRVG